MGPGVSPVQAGVLAMVMTAGAMRVTVPAGPACGEHELQPVPAAGPFARVRDGSQPVAQAAAGTYRRPRPGHRKWRRQGR